MTQMTGGFPAKFVGRTAIDPSNPDIGYVTFNGYSVNHDGIGELLLRLDKCTDLEGVTLKYSQERILEKEAKVLEFEISAVLAGRRSPFQGQR